MFDKKTLETTSNTKASSSSQSASSHEEENSSAMVVSVGARGEKELSWCEAAALVLKRHPGPQTCKQITEWIVGGSKPLRSTSYDCTAAA